MTSYAGLRADDSGGDAGPPIVLLHGLTFDRRIWEPVTRRMHAADPTRRIITLDLPGHGQSPAAPPHDLPRLVDLVHAALTEAQAGPPVLVGHSMAGAIVSLYAARYPVTAVVSVDQPPIIAPFAQLVRSLEPRMRGPQFGAIWQDVFAASFHLELLPEDARRLVEANSRPDRELVLGYWQMVLETPPEQLQATVDDALASIAARAVPYLLLLGAALPDAAEQRIRAQLPGVQIVVHPATGHFPHLARPDQFVSLVLDFAARLPAVRH
jgi:pimeloyl-ACP methyl ester carboxylesterase